MTGLKDQNRLIWQDRCVRSCASPAGV